MANIDPIRRGNFCNWEYVKKYSGIYRKDPDCGTLFINVNNGTTILVSEWGIKMAHHTDGQVGDLFRRCENEVVNFKVNT